MATFSEGYCFELGLQVGLSIPLDQDPTGPPLAEPQLGIYLTGVEAARSYIRARQTDYDGPAVEGAIEGGVTWEEFNRPVEQLLEHLFHQHEPDLEREDYRPEYNPYEVIRLRPVGEQYAFPPPR